MGKITCATCNNEYQFKCNAKKGRPSVAINKRRNCDKYVLDPEKVKVKQILKTVKMGYKEKEILRREYKEQLRLAKEQLKVSSDPKHPLTGDLSRFKSTVE